MSRVRVSTTVDRDRLERLRALSGLRDSELFDVALAAALRELTIARELEALDRMPYDTDPELVMPAAPDALDDGFDAPKRVHEMARRRRARRVSPASGG